MSIKSDVVYYLYVKTSPMGLKYLGKTTKNPYKYMGSGLVWKRHLSKYNLKYSDISTEILLETTSRDEIARVGLEFSIRNNIVNSKEWANLRPETGDGGDTSKFIDYTTRKPISDFTNHWSNQLDKKLGVLSKISTANKGKPSAFKGRVHTEYSKDLVRCKNKGKTPPNKGKISPYVGVPRPQHSKLMTGSGNSNAKGLIDSASGIYYSTIKEYKSTNNLTHYMVNKLIKENKIQLCKKPA